MGLPPRRSLCASGCLTTCRTCSTSYLVQARASLTTLTTYDSQPSLVKLAANPFQCFPDVAALNILNHFDFWSAVPLDGTATTSEIARHTNLPHEVVTRVLDHAKTLRLFTDAAPDSIRHTSRSAALFKNAGLRALVTTILDDAGPPMTVMPQALEKYNVGQETLPEDMSRTAFYMFHGGKYANSWEYIENDGDGEKKGWRSRNFTTFMGYLKDIFRLEQIVDSSYGWSESGDLSVVDVSGPSHSPQN